MSSTAAALAQALDAVPDITGYEDVSPMMNIGDAWPIRTGGEAAGPPLSFTDVWKVQVVMGGDPRSATEFLDAHLMPILEAVHDHAYVTKWERVDFQTANAGVLYGAEITAERES